MLEHELVLPYKLEKHLEDMCSSYPAYSNLLSVWNINKKRCQEILSTVIMNYPHYTKHDTSHCEAIITNIEMLLGEEAIQFLSPTDTWLLLHSAYLHDIGMAVACKKIEKNWETEEFQNYLRELENSDDEALVQNARFINSLGDKFEEKDNILSWLLCIRYSITMLIADYFRKRHASDSNSYIQDMGKFFDFDLGCNGLIQQRFFSLIGNLVGLHTEPCEKLLELDYQTNGYNADYAHPRFVAQMLRMGDLLDADNNRFNKANEVVFGKIPESSRNHWERHMSANHILITPNVIEYRADCSKVEVYRENRLFLSRLREEVEFWTLHWKDIMPESMKGTPPKLGKIQLLLNGVPDIQGLSELRFSISPEKAFEVIEGSNIYEDPFVFLREIIQNALDACKIQLWRDISEGRYRSWITFEADKLIQPFNIEQAVFDNYSIEVRISNYDEDYIKVVIKDNGIGLSADQLKKICNVGMSYSGDKKRKDEINGMPMWLRSTAGFGIGLQSVFLITEEFEIYSKSAGEDGIHARVESRQRNGYVQITKSNKLKNQGTEIHIKILRDLNFKYSLASNTYNYIENRYDPFSPKKGLLYYKIWDVLRDTMESTYFPLKLFFDDKLIDTIKSQRFFFDKEILLDERYMYKKISNYEMELWDTKTFTKIRLCLEDKYQIYNNRLFFKGMEIKNDVRLKIKGIRLEADFYGLETKRTLALNRNRIQKEALKEIEEILDLAVQFYLEKLEQFLFDDKENKEEIKYNQIYTYWCIVSIEKKIKLLKSKKDIFEKVQIQVTVLKKNNDNKFHKCKMDFKEVMFNLNRIASIRNLTDYIEHKGFIEQLNEELLIELLEIKDIPFSYILIDKDFSDMLKSMAYDKILVVTSSENVLCLTSFSTNERELPEPVDKDTRIYLLKSLLFKNSTRGIYGFHRNCERRYVIGIKEYAQICTREVPFGVVGEWYSGVGYIISPITTTQWEKNKGLDEDAFVNSMCTCEEFLNLVNHVYMHPFEKDKYSKEIIEKKYRDFIKDMYKVIFSDDF